MNLQENILRIKEVMGLNEQFPQGIDPKDLESQEVPLDDVQPEETPTEEQPKDANDFSNSVVPQVVWRAGRVSSSPKGGGIWFGEAKQDVENFAWSVRDEKREGLPYYINLQNPKYYDNFWNDYLLKARASGKDVLMKELMNAGYDGIIIDSDTWNDTGDEYAVTSKQFIVFNPKNVKPATEITVNEEKMETPLGTYKPSDFLYLKNLAEPFRYKSQFMKKYPKEYYLAAKAGIVDDLKDWDTKNNIKNLRSKKEETEGVGPYDAPAFEMKPDHIHFKHQYNEGEITERCWKGYTQKGMKTMFGKRYPNCVKKTK